MWFFVLKPALKLSPTPPVMLWDQERARATSRCGASTFSLNTPPLSLRLGAPHLDVQSLWGREWLGNKPFSLRKTLVFNTLCFFSLPALSVIPYWKHGHPQLQVFMYFSKPVGIKLESKVEGSPNTGLDLELCHCFHTGFTSAPG